MVVVDEGDEDGEEEDSMDIGEEEEEPISWQEEEDKWGPQPIRRENKDLFHLPLSSNHLIRFNQFF